MSKRSQILEEKAIDVTGFDRLARETLAALVGQGGVVSEVRSEGGRLESYTVKFNEPEPGLYDKDATLYKK